ncbi:WxL domain-containing protein [Carnobacterium gallinarum]|uniref:WxL domain-containing protein n=1 Tax=Carnobacterium gallinarum TaxID=2749 RepID=UPI0005543FF3|nr:WxL domain-containing protein [Carnobacterium gallinarum]
MKLTKVALVAIVTASSALGLANVSNAATGPVVPEQKTAESNAYATFTEYTGPNGQYKLHIESLSDINFGSLITEGNRTVYDAIFNANTDGTFSPTNIVTVDNRGTNAGWKLEVSNTQFSAGTEEDEKLIGAKLSFHSAKSTSADGDTTKLPPTILTPDSLTLNDSSVASALVLDGTNSLQTLLSAAGEERDASGVLVAGKLGEGIGTWLNEFGEVPADATAMTKNSAIKLEVPGGSKKIENKPYNSVLTWQLSDAP